MRRYAILLALLFAPLSASAQWDVGTATPKLQALFDQAFTYTFAAAGDSAAPHQDLTGCRDVITTAVLDAAGATTTIYDCPASDSTRSSCTEILTLRDGGVVAAPVSITRGFPLVRVNTLGSGGTLEFSCADLQNATYNGTDWIVDYPSGVGGSSATALEQTTTPDLRPIASATCSYGYYSDVNGDNTKDPEDQCLAGWGSNAFTSTQSASGWSLTTSGTLTLNQAVQAPTFRANDDFIVKIDANNDGPSNLFRVTDGADMTVYQISELGRHTNNIGLNSDACSTAGSWWWDSTDNKYEFCEASTGAPITIGSGGAGQLADEPTIGVTFVSIIGATPPAGGNLYVRGFSEDFFAVSDEVIVPGPDLATQSELDAHEALTALAHPGQTHEAEDITSGELDAARLPAGYINALSDFGSIGTCGALDIIQRNSGDTAWECKDAVQTTISGVQSGDLLIYQTTDWQNKTMSGDVTIASTGATTIGAAKVVENMLATSLVFDDGDLLDFGTFISSATEGIMLPSHATSCASATAEGQVCWEEDANHLWIGDGAAAVDIGPGAGGSGDITDVGAGYASGAAWTDGVVSTGTVGLLWEGTTSNASQWTLNLPADPTTVSSLTIPDTTAAITMAAGTGTLIDTGDSGTVTGTMLLDGTIQNADLDVAGESWDFSGGNFRAYTEVLTKTQSGTPHTITANETKSTLICNTGASGSAVYDLPSAVAGMTVTVCVAAAFDVDVNANTGDQILVLTNATGDAISSDATVGSIITLVALDATNWFPIGYRGTWSDVN